MERRGNKVRVDDADVAGQQRIQGLLPVEGGSRVGNIQMRDLCVGMYAGIGSSRAVHMYPIAKNMGHGIFDKRLNGGKRRRIFARLRLPAVVGGADIGDGELQARHEVSFGAAERRRYEKALFLLRSGAGSCGKSAVREYMLWVEQATQAEPRRHGRGFCAVPSSCVRLP